MEWSCVLGELVKYFRFVAALPVAEPPEELLNGQKLVLEFLQEHPRDFLKLWHMLEFENLRTQTACLQADAASLNLKPWLPVRHVRTRGQRPLRRLTKERRELWSLGKGC
jgi:hypothetical protein